MNNDEFLQFQEQEALFRQLAENQSQIYYQNNMFNIEEGNDASLTEEEQKRQAEEYVKNITGVDVSTNIFANAVSLGEDINPEDIGVMMNTKNNEYQPSESMVWVDANKTGNPEIDKLMDSLFGELTNKLEEGEKSQEPSNGNVSFVKSSFEEIPPEQTQELGNDGPNIPNVPNNDGVNSQDGSEFGGSNGTATSSAKVSEMNRSLEYVRTHLSGRKDLYVNKQDIENINNQYFRDLAELKANLGDSKFAEEKAREKQTKALDNLCAKAKPYNEKTFREMQQMAAERGGNKSFDVIHWSPKKKGQEHNNLTEVRVSGTSMTAKQMKELQERRQQDGHIHHNMTRHKQGITHGMKSMIGADAQGMFQNTIAISTGLLMVVLDKLAKTINDDYVKAVQKQVQKQVDLDPTDIDLNKILEEVAKDFEQSKNQIENAQSNEETNQTFEEATREENEEETQNTSNEGQTNDTNEENKNSNENKTQEESVASVLNEGEPSNEASNEVKEPEEPKGEPKGEPKKEVKEDVSDINDITLETEKEDSSKADRLFGSAKENVDISEGLADEDKDELLENMLNQ